MPRPRKEGQKRLTVYLDSEHAALFDDIVARYRACDPRMAVSSIVQLMIRNHDADSTVRKLLGGR